MKINGPSSDLAFDLLRAILEPSRPCLGRGLALTVAMGWRELSEPGGSGLMGGRSYRVSVSGDYVGNVLCCYTTAWTTTAVGRVPIASEQAGAFMIPMNGVEFHRTWPEDEGIRVFVACEVAGAGTATCRLNGMAPGALI